MNDGGPAFPRDHVIVDANDPAFKRGAEGMSLRDLFAEVVLPPLVNAADALMQRSEAQGQVLSFEGVSASIARRAYQLADAMLAERAKAGRR